MRKREWNSTILLVFLDAVWCCPGAASTDPDVSCPVAFAAVSCHRLIWAGPDLSSHPRLIKRRRDFPFLPLGFIVVLSCSIVFQDVNMVLEFHSRISVPFFCPPPSLRCPFCSTSPGVLVFSFICVYIGLSASVWRHFSLCFFWNRMWILQWCLWHRCLHNFCIWWNWTSSMTSLSRYMSDMPYVAISKNWLINCELNGGMQELNRMQPEQLSFHGVSWRGSFIEPIMKQTAEGVVQHQQTTYVQTTDLICKQPRCMRRSFRLPSAVWVWDGSGKVWMSWTHSSVPPASGQTFDGVDMTEEYEMCPPIIHRGLWGDWSLCQLH